ncbi:MAG: HAMP domain-containing sensor histidine kinase [Verrucomicrobiota bacterium]
MLHRISIVLVLAVLLPSAVLAFLAVRSLQHQQIVLEGQQGLFSQEVVDGVALRIDAYMQNLQNKFALEVDEMLAGKGGGIPPEQFNRALRLRWPLAKVGFVVDSKGLLLSPRPGANPVEQKFLEDNRLFFANSIEQVVYHQNSLPQTQANSVTRREKKNSGKSLLVSLAKLKDGSLRMRSAIVDHQDTEAVSSQSALTYPYSTGGRDAFANMPMVEETLALSSDTVMAFDGLSSSEIAPRRSLKEKAERQNESLDAPPEVPVPPEEVSAEEAPRTFIARPAASPMGSVAMKARPPRQLMRPEAEPAPEEPADKSDEYARAAAAEKTETTQSPVSTRRVSPTQRFDDQNALLSKVQPEYAAFQSLVGDARKGAYARFLQDQLSVFFWYRPPAYDGKIFGVELSMPALRESIATLLDKADTSRYQKGPVPVALAILDDKAQPVGVEPPSFSADWRRPFVATELGQSIEILPHWEVAAYLLHPHRLQQAATYQSWFLGSVTGLMLLAVGVGGVVLWRDFRREVVSARQKTDFVSNVSHELKTPLTSIRMFSELLRRQTDAPASSENQQRYLDIIVAEASRLTRLINNILDFSRMEQSRKQYRMAGMDLAELTREIAVAYRAHLEQSGFTLEVSKEDVSLPVSADRDAITQVLLNLISNAEKYGGDAKDIRIELARDPLHGQALLRVLDRGPGVPRGHETQIFKKFYRAHDSLSSGIQGSGLGLTLALSIAQAHGGTLRYASRKGGGACFTLVLPLAESPEKGTKKS